MCGRYGVSEPMEQYLDELNAGKPITVPFERRPLELFNVAPGSHPPVISSAGEEGVWGAMEQVS